MKAISIIIFKKKIQFWYTRKENNDWSKDQGRYNNFTLLNKEPMVDKKMDSDQKQNLYYVR